MTVSLVQLRQMVATLKHYAIPPAVVASAAEARRFTRDDPFGHVWRVGEEYYLVFGARP